MAGFVLRRLAFGLLTVIGVVVVTFLISHVIPADPAALIAGERATHEQIEAVRRLQGFDRPLAVQLIDYIARVAAGDLGKSLTRAARSPSICSRDCPRRSS